MHMHRILKNIALTAILVMVAIMCNAQQDAQFSQNMFNGIYTNPAYAGYKEELNLHTFYRSQWTGIKGSPRTMSVAVDAIANEGNVGLALQISSDRLGAQKGQSVYANYAYRLRLNADGSARLAFGLGAGAVQNGIDAGLLNTNDTEMGMPVGMHSKIAPDARAGIYLATNKFYVGISADNLVSQYIDSETYDFIPQPKAHYYVTAGMLFPINENVQLKPSFLLKDDRGGPTSLDINAFIILSDKFWLGAAYRTGVKLYSKDNLQKSLSQLNSAVAAVQIIPSDRIRIAYAHDFSMGALQGYGGGTHEISLAYHFNRKTIRMATPRYF